MTSKADFTDEEWTRLKRAPFVAGMAISLADPGGPIEAVRETSATLRTVMAEAEGGGHGDLVSAVAREAADDARHRRNPLAGFRPGGGGTPPGEQILDELGAVNRIVSEKATPEDAAAIRVWLMAAAQAAADAAKEGGFMGFRAERVSQGEQEMLDRLNAVLTA